MGEVELTKNGIEHGLRDRENRTKERSQEIRCEGGEIEAVVNSENVVSIVNVHYIDEGLLGLVSARAIALTSVSICYVKGLLALVRSGHCHLYARTCLLN